MKKKLLVSFSGGETSAYMAQWLWKHKQDEYEMVFVFANTGQENEETLEFIEKCSNYFGFPVIWVEGVFSKEYGVGVRSKVVDYNTADREGKVFEEMISVYGIPNQSFPHCTRELKGNVINHYARHTLGWKKFYTAIGIRSDEADRIKKPNKKIKPIYPLISREMNPTVKPQINFWWSIQPFRLELKGYQGNCKWCWKKNLNKLQRIAHENPHAFDFPLSMEKKYGNFTPESRSKCNPPYTFFRDNKSAKDILNSAYPHKIVDDSFYSGHQLDLIGGESCEVWSECSN